MSAELLFEGNPNHYLVYGITKEFLDSYGKVYIFLIMGSLLICLGVIISLIFTVRGI